MTAPRNEVFMSLGPEEEDISISAPSPSPAPPAPPAPTQGVAEIVPPTPDVEVIDPEIETVDMKLARRKYVEQGKRQTLERYELQESKRAPRIQIDQAIVLNTWIGAVAIAFLTSAIVSFNGITSVAVFVGLSQAWMASLFFFFVEIMYLLFLMAYLILASRSDSEGNKERTRGAVAGMVFFAGVAVLANGFHTLDYWQWEFTEPRAWAGFVLSIAAPIAIISISKMASRVVFAESVKL